MRLGEWLETNERSAAWLARQLEVSRETVSAWIAGDFSPSVERAVKIEEITGGAVRADGWARPAREGV